MSYFKIIKDALAWLDENEPRWQLEKPIDRDAFLEDLLSRAGFDTHWHEGECKDIRDQKAKGIGIVDKKL